MLIERDQGLDRSGRGEQSQQQFPVMKALVRSQKLVEVERQIVLGSVGYHAYGGAGEVGFPAESPDGGGFQVHAMELNRAGAHLEENGP
jgi:hypothetical protein